MALCALCAKSMTEVTQWCRNGKPICSSHDKRICKECKCHICDLCENTSIHTCKECKGCTTMCEMQCDCGNYYCETILPKPGECKHMQVEEGSEIE